MFRGGAVCLLDKILLKKRPLDFSLSWYKETLLIGKIANDISSQKKVRFLDIHSSLTIFGPSKLSNSLLQFHNFLVFCFKLVQENFCR